MSDYTIVPLQAFHKDEAMGIFNHYIEHSFSAYFESPLPDAYFDRLLLMVKGYPALAAHNEAGDLLGFGFLNAWHAAFSFRHTAELTCFVHPDHLRKGVGSMLLRYLVAQGAKKGVTTLLASVSSRNPESLAFHAHHGFEERGRLLGIGKKFDKTFDVLYLQRDL